MLPLVMQWIQKSSQVMNALLKEACPPSLRRESSLGYPIAFLGATQISATVSRRRTRGLANAHRPCSDQPHNSSEAAQRHISGQRQILAAFGHQGYSGQAVLLVIAPFYAMLPGSYYPWAYQSDWQTHTGTAGRVVGIGYTYSCPTSCISPWTVCSSHRRSGVSVCVHHCY